MPIYQIDIQKSFQTEFWTNVYYCNVANSAAALNTAAALVDMERPFHLTFVNFDKYRVSTVQEGDFVYQTVPLGLPGTRGFTADALPFFNVVRVDLTDNVKRPGRKFYRGVLQRTDVVANFEVLASLRTLVQNGVNAVVAAPGLTDRNGVPVQAAVVHQMVGMRQLRRGSRRRTQSII